MTAPSVPADLQIHQRVTKHRDGDVPALLLLQETILASPWREGEEGGQILGQKA